MALLAAACGASDSASGQPATSETAPVEAPTTAIEETTSTAPPTTAELTTEAPTSTAPEVLRIEVGDAILGPILTDGRGRAIYGFTQDEAGEPFFKGVIELSQAYRIVGALAGTLHLLLWLSLIRGLPGASGAGLALAGLAAGGNQVFFGHVENYAFAALCGTLYLTAGWAALAGRLRPGPASAQRRS